MMILFLGYFDTIRVIMQKPSEHLIYIRVHDAVVYVKKRMDMLLLFSTLLFAPTPNYNPLTAASANTVCVTISSFFLPVPLLSSVQPSLSASSIHSFQLSWCFTPKQSDNSEFPLRTSRSLIP